MTEIKFTAENFPTELTPKQTYELFAESGCFASNYTPWWQVIDRVQDEDGEWKLRVYEYDVDEDEPITERVYEITHRKIIEAILTIAADLKIRKDFRRMLIALLVDPDGWDTQPDQNDEDVVLQYAAWGEQRYS